LSRGLGGLQTKTLPTDPAGSDPPPVRSAILAALQLKARPDGAKQHAGAGHQSAASGESADCNRQQFQPVRVARMPPRTTTAAPGLAPRIQAVSLVVSPRPQSGSPALRPPAGPGTGQSRQTLQILNPHLSPVNPSGCGGQAVGVIGADPGHTALTAGAGALLGGDPEGLDQLKHGSTAQWELTDQLGQADPVNSGGSVTGVGGRWRGSVRHDGGLGGHCRRIGRPPAADPAQWGGATADHSSCRVRRLCRRCRQGQPGPNGGGAGASVGGLWRPPP